MPEYHAKLSPSGSHRWIHCPGSINLEEQLVRENKIKVDDDTNEYAAEGTVAHSILSICVEEYIDCAEFGNPRRFLGHTMEADGFSFIVNEDMVDAVECAIEYLLGTIESNTDETFEQTVKVYSETWVSLESYGIEGLEGGTADVILIFEESGTPYQIEVFDYKHGSGVYVNAKGNSQLRCYGLGAAIEHDLLDSNIGIRLTICQPRIHGIEDTNRVRSEEMGMADLLNWSTNVLIPAAIYTKDKKAPIKPNDEACRFCSCAGNCPERYKLTVSTAMVDFEDLEPSLPTLDTLTVEQKTLIVEYGNLIVDFVGEVRLAVLHEIDRGSLDYEGRLKLVQGMAKRKYNDNAFDELDSELFDYFDEDDLFNKKPKGITEIEKQLKAEVGKTETKRIMDSITTKPNGSLTVAPVSDLRIPAQPTVVTDFIDI